MQTTGLWVNHAERPAWRKPPRYDLTPSEHADGIAGSCCAHREGRKKLLSGSVMGGATYRTPMKRGEIQGTWTCRSIQRCVLGHPGAYCGLLRANEPVYSRVGSEARSEYVHWCSADSAVGRRLLRVVLPRLGGNSLKNTHRKFLRQAYCVYAPCVLRPILRISPKLGRWTTGYPAPTSSALPIVGRPDRTIDLPRPSRGSPRRLCWQRPSPTD